MRKTYAACIAVVLAAALSVPEAWAQRRVQPVQIAFFNPIQIFDEKTSIHGVRVNLLYGSNRNVLGLDVGFLNTNTGAFKGVQLGVVGVIDGETYDRESFGWQGNLGNVVLGEMTGLQSGFYNGAETCEGVQIGLLNKTSSMHGWQLGVVNVTDEMNGLQIGLINIIKFKEKYSVLPIVNWSF